MKINDKTTIGMAANITLALCFCCASATAAPKSSPKTLTYTERMDLVRETMGVLRSKIPTPEFDMSALNKSNGEYDAATLYALAIATIKYQDGEAGWRKAGKHMLKAAEMAYPNAEVAVAIKLHSRLSGDWYADYLRELCSMSIYEALETDERKAHYTDVAREFYNKAIAHGFPCLTNMLTVLESELQDAKATEQARLEKERIAKELKLSELRKAGVTSPFVLFNELGKMDYQTTVAKAKENDPQAYYWLSYYFAKGEGVERDGKAAWRCLTKAAALGNPDANYAKGLFYEQRAFPTPNGDYLGYFGQDFSFDVDKWGCDVNDDAEIAGVVALYNRAVSGGLTFATNDIVRFRQKICVKRGEVAKAKSLERAAGDVLKALEQEERAKDEAERKLQAAQKKAADEKAQKNAAEEAARKAEEENRQKAEAKKKAEQEFWATWPKEVSGLAGDILLACEKELGTVVEHRGSNCVWSSTCGKSFISRMSYPLCDRDWTIWRKYDRDGKLVKVGQAKTFSEYVWLTNRAERMTIEQRRLWAEEHSMSYEEAVKKYEAYYESYLKKKHLLVRPRTIGPQGTSTRAMGSLRERRAQREQLMQVREEQMMQIQEELKKAREEKEKAAAEQAVREKERDEQRAQLLKIQEELNKQRSGKE